MVRLYASSSAIKDSNYTVYLDKDNIVSWALGNIKPTDVIIVDQGLSRDDALLLAKQVRRELRTAV